MRTAALILLASFSLGLFCAWVMSWVQSKVIKEVWSTIATTCSGGIMLAFGLLVIHYKDTFSYYLFDDKVHSYFIEICAVVIGTSWLAIAIIIWAKQMFEFIDDFKWAIRYKKEHQ